MERRGGSRRSLLDGTQRWRDSLRNKQGVMHKSSHRTGLLPSFIKTAAFTFHPNAFPQRPAPSPDSSRSVQTEVYRVAVAEADEQVGVFSNSIFRLSIVFKAIALKPIPVLSVRCPRIDRED